MDGSFTVARTDQMSAAARRIALAVASLLISFPTWGQSPPANTPFVGNWEGVVAVKNQNNTVRMTIAPFSNGFAAKVVHFGQHHSPNWYSRAAPSASSFRPEIAMTGCIWKATRFGVSSTPRTTHKPSRCNLPGNDRAPSGLNLTPVSRVAPFR